MLKRVVVLLLFVQFSFSQENQSSLELDKEGGFSFGFTYESSFASASTSQNKMFKFLLGNELVTTYINYKAFRKFILGFSIGLQPEFSSPLLERRARQQYYKMGLRLGYVLNDDSQIIFTKSEIYHNDFNLYIGYPEQKRYTLGNINHWSLSFIYNTGNLSPEIGLTYVSYGAGVVDANKVSSSASGSFIMPSIGLNYKIYPSKKRAIKKLTQAKNALDLELITQEEYDKVYVKYAHFSKDKP